MFSEARAGEVPSFTFKPRCFYLREKGKNCLAGSAWVSADKALPGLWLAAPCLVTESPRAAGPRRARGQRTQTKYSWSAWAGGFNAGGATGNRPADARSRGLEAPKFAEGTQ